MSPYAPRESVGQTEERPKSKMATILDLLKSAILRRFYSNNTIEVSFLTRKFCGEKSIPGVSISNFGHFHPEIQDGRHFTSDNKLKSGVSC